MSLSFDSEKIKKISAILGVEPDKYDDSWIWKLTSPDTKKPLVCTLYHNIENDSKKLSLISVQTQHGYYEMHNISDLLIFEPDEVIFINKKSEKISCLILGKEGSCSLFSNIDKNLISADFAELNPALLLSAMQLSITESVVN